MDTAAYTAAGTYAFLGMAQGIIDDASWHGVVGAAKKHDRKVMEDAKQRARGDLNLSEWMKQGYAYHSTCLAESSLGHIAREHARSLTVEDFRQRYEVANLPVIIDGCTEGWRAATGVWHPSALYETYRHRKFKVGEDDEGYPVKIKLKYFLRYASGQRDDSPLYVFDSMFERGARDCAIRHDYEVPPYFREDLFRLAGEHRRPPYRWFLVGPRRSGTGVHLDPLGTSAWNTLLHGRKRWVLFPPDVPRDVVRPRAYLRRDKGEDDEPVDYFTLILPRIKAAHPGLAARMVEFTQRPGETVYVPGGWWHA